MLLLFIFFVAAYWAYYAAGQRLVPVMVNAYVDEWDKLEKQKAAKLSAASPTTVLPTFKVPASSVPLTPAEIQAVSIVNSDTSPVSVETVETVVPTVVPADAGRPRAIVVKQGPHLIRLQQQGDNTICQFVSPKGAPRGRSWVIPMPVKKAARSSNIVLH